MAAQSQLNTCDAVVELLAKTKVTDGQVAAEEEGLLSFANRSLKLNTEAEADEVVQEIRKCKNMKILRLEGNTFGVDAAKAIAKALEGHPELERAQWKDMFTGRLKSEIPQALRFLSGGLMLAKVRLVELDLSDNAFGPVGIEGIAEMLKSQVCYSLKELRLNNNGLGINGGKLLAKSLLECLKRSSSAGTPLKLSVFVCGRNRLENEGAEAISRFFKAITTLKEVQMPQNGIFHQGITSLAQGLQNNTNLVHLNFNDNIFTEVGANSIAEVLPKLQDLEIINFGDCLLKSKGAHVLAEALHKGHSKLKELYLSFNEINAESAIEIAECLEMKKDLQKLDLDGNQIGFDGCELIKGILETFNKLDALGSLDDDEGDDEGDDDNDDDYEDVDDDDDDDNEKSDVKEVDDSKINTPKETNVIRSSEKIIPIPCSAIEYLASPSQAKLLGLGNSRASLLLAEIKKVNEENFDKWMEIFVKIAAVVKADSDEDVIRAAKECIDSVLSEAFIVSSKNKNEACFSNSLLVYLGLIKSEDKKFRPPTDLSGFLLMLDHAVRQPYFSRATKEVLQLFLSSKFQKAIEHTGPIKHQLMQTLYKY